MHFRISSCHGQKNNPGSLVSQDVLVPVSRTDTDSEKSGSGSMSVQLDTSYNSTDSSIHSIQAYLESPLDSRYQRSANSGAPVSNLSDQDHNQADNPGPDETPLANEDEDVCLQRPHVFGYENQRCNLWNDEHEVIAYQWKSVCDKKAVQHMETAIVMKFLYHLMSFPIYTVPLIASQVQRFQEAKKEWQTPLQYLLTFNAVLAGLNTAANLGKRSEQHFNLESQFSRLGKLIGVEMEKPRECRQKPKSFLVTLAYQMETLFAISPNLACAKGAKYLITFVRCIRRCCSRNTCCLKNRRVD